MKLVPSNILSLTTYIGFNRVKSKPIRLLILGSAWLNTCSCPPLGKIVASARQADICLIWWKSTSQFWFNTVQWQELRPASRNMVWHCDSESHNHPPPPTPLCFSLFCLKSRLFWTCVHAQCHVHFFHHGEFYFRLIQLITFEYERQGLAPHAFFGQNRD